MCPDGVDSCFSLKQIVETVNRELRFLSKVGNKWSLLVKKLAETVGGAGFIKKRETLAKSRRFLNGRRQ